MLVAAVAVAQDEETPDLAFLEYLGSWEDSDEDWLVVAENLDAAADDETSGEEKPGAEEDDSEHDDED
jgi:hypothetical protein